MPEGGRTFRGIGMAGHPDAGSDCDPGPGEPKLMPEAVSGTDLKPAPGVRGMHWFWDILFMIAEIVWWGDRDDTSTRLTNRQAAIIIGVALALGAAFFIGVVVWPD